MDGYTIAQIGDFHYHATHTAPIIEAAVQEVDRVKPDAVVLMGDYVRLPGLGWDHASHKAQALAGLAPCTGLLQQLPPSTPKFAVLGNHDCIAGAEIIAESLQSIGIELLRNRSVPLELDGSRIWFAGVDDALQGRPDLERTLGKIPKREVVILLGHEPDYADEAARYSVDLQLSGHSHGGQVRLPLVGAPYLPPLGRKYPMGLYYIGKLKLYTNCGIGTVEMPVRLNCPPEITLLTLRSGYERSALNSREAPLSRPFVGATKR